MTDPETHTPSNPPTTPDAPETPTTGSADAATPKTYTESEVNAMMTARLAKQEKALRAQAAEDAKKAAERAQLDEVERVKAEKIDLEKKAAEAEARAVAAERRAALTGQVADAAAALKLLDEAKHLNEDGTVNATALLADYPFLKPPAPGTAAIGGANPRGQKDASQMSDEEYFRTRTSTK